MDCYGKLEIILPSISGNDLENIVTFLYSGRILCTDPTATSRILSNLTDLLGFPESMELSGAVKDEIQTENQDMTYEAANELNHYESPADYLEYRIVASTNTCYYSENQLCVQRSQYIRTKNPLHKQSEKAKTCH